MSDDTFETMMAYDHFEAEIDPNGDVGHAFRCNALSDLSPFYAQNYSIAPPNGSGSAIPARFSQGGEHASHIGKETTQTAFLEDMVADSFCVPSMYSWQSSSTFVVDQGTLQEPLQPVQPYANTSRSPAGFVLEYLPPASRIMPLVPGSFATSNAETLPAFEGDPPPLDVPANIETSGNEVVSAYRRHNSSGYVFQCKDAGCRNITFNRWYDFERHDNAFHNGTSVLWCPELGCNRSKAAGNKPFPMARKDKLKEHVRKLHGVEYDG